MYRVTNRSLFTRPVLFRELLWVQQGYSSLITSMCSSASHSSRSSSTSFSRATRLCVSQSHALPQETSRITRDSREPVEQFRKHWKLHHQGRSQVFITGGQAGAMLNLLIKLYCKIIIRENFYCKIFNFKKIFKFV